MAVAVGDQRRKKEAMELLVTEIAKGDEENVTSSLRTAIEVSVQFLVMCCYFAYLTTFNIAAWLAGQFLGLSARSKEEKGCRD